MTFGFLRRLLVVGVGSGVVFGIACSSTQSSRPTLAPPTQDASRLQLFLLAGQSNMAGRGTVEAQDSVVNPRVLTLHSTMRWVPAVDPLHWDKPAIVGVGPGRTFGLALAAHDPSARIGLVPAAVGGSPISSWEPGALDSATRTHPYDDALARLRIAQKDGTLRAILWHQGESDATPERSVLYAAKLRALIARFRAEAGDPTLPFVIGQLGQFAGKPWSDDVRRVDSVHRAIAASVPNVAYVSSDGLRDKGDTLHFDAASQRTFGERYAAAYLKLAKP
ncbi:MAG: sialate O-acetylesterase [Gemmatimonadetes bacterium]|nr:MAG: sialate O-acetylesterase [Gemmatimonadota bacterium]